MTAAGEAVLAVAMGEVGYVEGPNNSTKYWDWYGGNYGPWCGVFDMWCSAMAGYPKCTDSVLVSNGTVHGYTTVGSGATGVEAQRTLDLQPGDSVLFSWEPWEFRGGVPTCVGEWDGYPAGDHIGIFAYWVDQGAGRFAAVEGNTSDGSWDNGGMVMLREDRWTSQVCGWWRAEAIATDSGPTTPPQPQPLYGGIDVIFYIRNPQAPDEVWVTDGMQKRYVRHMEEVEIVRSMAARQGVQNLPDSMGAIDVGTATWGGIPIMPNTYYPGA